MNTITTIISGLLILNIIIIIHEFGHYISAKKCNVYAPVFAIGFGPKIWTFYKTKETSFELRAIPFGGFVQMASSYETEEELKIPEGKYALEDISKLKQIWIISAGAIFNFIFAILIYFFIGFFSGSTTQQVKIENVSPSSKAINVLKKDDVILSINNNEVTNANNIMLYLNENNKVLVLRDKQKVTLDVKAYLNPKTKNKTYLMGVNLSVINNKAQKYFAGGFSNVLNSFKDVWDMQMTTFRMLFSGRANLSDMSGPVGIINSTGQIVNQKDVQWSDKFIAFLNWMATISIAIGFANLLLFILPVVDGGRIFLIILSAIFRKDLSQSKIVSWLMNICIVLMLSFFIYITIIDLFFRN